MRLIIGGYKQGKLNYALQTCTREYVIFKDKIPSKEELDSCLAQNKEIIIANFQVWFKDSCRIERDEVSDAPEETIKQLLFDVKKESLMGKPLQNQKMLQVKNNLQGKNNLHEQNNLQEKNTLPQLTIISDEIGNGIVPMDAFEREYRERLGRILIEIAKESDEVVRVFCGIGQKIK